SCVRIKCRRWWTFVTKVGARRVGIRIDDGPASYRTTALEWNQTGAISPPPGQEVQDVDGQRRSGLGADSARRCSRGSTPAPRGYRVALLGSLLRTFATAGHGPFERRAVCCPRSRRPRSVGVARWCRRRGLLEGAMDSRAGTRSVAD